MASKEISLVVCIILNWNGMSINSMGAPILMTTMASLAKTNYSNMKILVVDADSEDDSLSYIKKISRM